mgnify:CR=1 FL=1
MRKLKCEAIKGDAQSLQPMIDALNENPSRIKEPGAQPINSDISDVVINFLDESNLLTTIYINASITTSILVVIYWRIYILILLA